jgi:WD40 repeat protein
VATLSADSGAPLECVAFSGDWRILACHARGEKTNSVLFWDTSTWKVCWTIRNGDVISPVKVTLAADGKHVAGIVNGVVQLWDVPTGDATQLPVKATSDTDDLKFSPDGKLLAVGTGRKLHAVTLVDTACGRVVAVLPVRGKPNPLAFSPDGQTLAAEYMISGVPIADHGVRLWDVAARCQRDDLGGYGNAGVTFVAFSPDGRLLATTSTEQVIRVWDLAVNPPRVRWRQQEAAPQGLAFSPDGRVILFGDRLGEVKFNEAGTGKEVRTLKVQFGEVRSLALSPDGKLLAVATGLPSVTVWDVSGILKGVADAGPATSPGHPLAASPVGKDLSSEDLQTQWSALAGEDAQRAYLAIWALAEAPQQAVPFLAKQLRPATAPDPERTEQLLTDLDNAAPAVRGWATQELQELGALAGPALRRELAKQRSAEVGRQVKALLDRVPEETLTAQQLQAVRAVAALEHMGTPEARRLLTTLTDGAPEARLTHEARSALERLAGRPTAL